MYPFYNLPQESSARGRGLSTTPPMSTPSLPSSSYPSCAQRRWIPSYYSPATGSASLSSSACSSPDQNRTEAYKDDHHLCPAPAPRFGNPQVAPSWADQGAQGADYFGILPQNRYISGYSSDLSSLYRADTVRHGAQPHASISPAYQVLPQPLGATQGPSRTYPHAYSTSTSTPEGEFPFQEYSGISSGAYDGYVPAPVTTVSEPSPSPPKFPYSSLDGALSDDSRPMKKYQCPHAPGSCSSTGFSTKGSYNRHLKDKHLGRLNVCENRRCGRTFADSTSLWRHKKTCI
ncbi:hypothetical protein CYLTODRAFT_455651 [Cylindrobasidium torrendii FP15055 ss-10]|uniref:C2H2-type domain-containing protein n=1 Tax=Cylindrobasidium torrendii FP15055 ss-10 TaxID=1314674 RepID=A0A0D7B6K7_9AGAR|nr:hypothetical protein CYLTODRAFT_455651 [Cylindrobasidium torrendii FP15055 ss-10]